MTLSLYCLLGLVHLVVLIPFLCPLSMCIFCYSLPVAHCLLSIAYCLLRIACCVLPVAHCLFPSACFPVPVAYCQLPTVHCSSCHYLFAKDAKRRGDSVIDYQSSFISVSLSESTSSSSSLAWASLRCLDCSNSPIARKKF